MSTGDDANVDFFDTAATAAPTQQSISKSKSPSSKRDLKRQASSPTSLATKGSRSKPSPKGAMYNDLAPINPGGRGDASGSSPGGEDGGETVYSWDGFGRRVGPRTRRSFVLCCALIASLGSFCLGYSISILNTALSQINSEFLQCGPKKTEFQPFWDSATESCAQDPKCRQACGVYTDPLDRDHMTGVRCPGGHNDTSCPEIKWANAALVSIVLVGGAIGAGLGGRFVKNGRRRLQITEHCVMIAGSLISICSTTYQALILGRLIVGVGIGLTSVASPTFISEMSPASKRGMYGGFHQLSVVMGQLAALAIGIPLESPDEQNDSWKPSLFDKIWWRSMLGFVMILNLLALYCLLQYFTMETPFYYAEHRQFNDAEAALQLVNQKSDVQTELSGITNSIRQIELNRQSGLTFSQACRRSPEYLRVVIVGCLLAGFQQFGGINVFMTSSADLFRKNGMDRNMQIIMTITMGLLLVIFTIPSLIFVERLGRRILLLVGSAFQFLFIVPAAVLYQLEEVPSNPSQATRLASTIGIFGFVSAFSLAFGPVVWVYLFEIFPVEIKDAAASLATAFNWTSAVIMVFAARVLPNQVSFALFAGLQLLATIFIFFCVRETKGLALGDSPYITKPLSSAV